MTRVLVVDDDTVDRMSVRRALRAAGIEADVIEASSFAEGLVAAREAPDVVFLDYLLPDGTGLELMGALRELGLRAPIIVLTGQGDEATAVKLMKAGATDYLPKATATPERIAQCVRSAIRLHDAESLAEAAERQRVVAIEHEKEARAEASVAQRRLSFLAEASALLASSLDPSQTMENVARLAVPFLADWCWIDLVQPDGSFERVAVAHRDPSQASLAARLKRRYPAMRDAPHGASRVIVTGQAEILSTVPDWTLVSVARDAEHLEVLRALRLRSLLITPLVARERVLGAVTFANTESARAYELADLAFVEELSRRAAQALDNARLYQAAREAEERSRRQLEFTTAITNSLREGVLAVDTTGVIVFANPAATEILGRPLQGAKLLDVLRADEVSHDLAQLASAVEANQPLRLDRAVFADAQGRRIHLALSTAPLTERSGLAGAVLAFHDIADRLLAERELDASRRQLAQSEKLSALGTLVSGVAHELRTPLTYLSNNMFLLRRRLDVAVREDSRLAPLSDELRRYETAALEGVERINALVKDLRPFAKAEASPRLQRGLETLVADAVELYRVTSRGQVKVEARLAPTGPVLAEVGRFQRVVINLLVNAAEAMPHGGTVRVETRAGDDGPELRVLDEGPGIAPEVQSRVFDPFFTTKPDGTGLGLAITRRIVEAHGGTITFETSPGAGTTFIVRLPAVRQLDVDPPATIGLQPTTVGRRD